MGKAGNDAPFTPEQIKAYIKSDASACPSCGSESIEGERFESEGNQAWQDIRCNTCGEAWQDIYARTHVARGTEASAAQQIATVEPNSNVPQWKI